MAHSPRRTLSNGIVNMDMISKDPSMCNLGGVSSIVAAIAIGKADPFSFYIVAIDPVDFTFSNSAFTGHLRVWATLSDPKSFAKPDALDPKDSKNTFWLVVSWGASLPSATAVLSLLHPPVRRTTRTS